jgi:hypothetical protein
MVLQILTRGKEGLDEGDTGRVSVKELGVEPLS